jgi:hypothetical protein
MISKFAGPCINCAERIKAGQTIKFFGRGKAAHFSCEAPDRGDEDEGEEGEDERAGFEPGTLANDRRAARRGLSVTRFSSGETVTRCGCIDYPCCGC